MGATIGEDVNLTVGMAGDDHWPVAHMGGNILAGFGKLTFMGDKQPGVAVNPFHFGFENGRVGIDPSVHAAFRR